MALALFDLDKTLIAGDSDFLWGEFLAQKGIVDKLTYQAKNKEFFADYARGALDIQKYLEFCLHPLTLYDLPTLISLRDEFVESSIYPLIHKQAYSTIKQHKNLENTIVVISATNEFIVEGVTALFDIDYVIATHAEKINGKFTGKSTKTPCFKEGKVTNLNQWLQPLEFDLKGSYFYSDSHNDIALLSEVEHAIAVNPDEVLLAHAHAHHWQVEYWQ